MAKDRTARLVLRSMALACALACAAPASRAGNFDATIFFGDSLSDAGTFGAKFTTNPSLVWPEVLANRLGTQARPFNAGGTDFAVGGARVTLLPGVPNSPPTDTAMPIATQINTYLGASGQANPRALYGVWGGANDVFVATALGAGAPAYLAQTAGELAAQIARLQAAGARFIVVPNLPDIGATPFGASLGPAGAAGLTQLSAGYNAALYTEIRSRGLRVIAVDTFGLLREVTANPAAYGFVNTTIPACGATPSLLCTPANLVAPDAAQTFLYADGVHPTGGAHAVIADYVASMLAGPGQISMLPESALKSRSAHVDRLYVRLADPAAAASGRQLWLTVDGQRTGLASDGIASGASGDGAGLTLGLDLFRASGMVLGAAIGVSTLKPEFGNGGYYRQDETLLSLYGGWNAGPWGIKGVLSYGALQHDVKRDIRLGAATRTASGSPGGGDVSLGLEGSYRFSAGALSHGPLAGVLLQRAKVDGYAEEGAGSASLRYGEQQRSSAVGRLGWQLAYDAGRWQPYARLTLDRELRDPARDVEAQAVTAPDLPTYSMPAVEPARNYGTFLVGTGVQISRGWSGNLALSHSAQSGARGTSAFVTVSTSF